MLISSQKCKVTSLSNHDLGDHSSKYWWFLTCARTPPSPAPELVTLTSCSRGRDDQISGPWPIKLWRARTRSYLQAETRPHPRATAPISESCFEKVLFHTGFYHGNAGLVYCPRHQETALNILGQDIFKDCLHQGTVHSVIMLTVWVTFNLIFPPKNIYIQPVDQDLLSRILKWGMIWETTLTHHEIIISESTRWRFPGAIEWLDDRGPTVLMDCL